MRPGECASKVRLTGLILGTDMLGETTTSCAEQDNPGEGLDSAAWCHVFLALGVLQTEGGCEGCGQSVSVVARRWQPRALGRAVGSEGAKHQDAAGLDGTRCRGDIPLALVGPDQEVEHGPIVPGVVGTLRLPGQHVCCLLYTSPSPRDGLL